MNNRWYKQSTVYQIYPRSFQDSDGDGIGDIKGIISRLDYLKSLGIDAVWLSPIYESPLDDNGYDISDYRSVLKEYGTLDDFQEMVSEMHKRGIRLIMDLVVNHTSDEHRWFQEAKKDISSPYHDYYIFRKSPTGKKPNNWRSFFGGSAWEYNPDTDEYYLHLFSKKQPDLNWENPQVREEVKDILRFWLDLGVDGFRCDVINLISKKEGLPSTRGIPILSGQGIYINGPKIHQYLQELRDDVFRKYNVFTVGECILITPEIALQYIEEGTDELNMVFQFEHMSADNFLLRWIPHKFRLIHLKKALSKWQDALSGWGWNSLYLENHDQPRSVSRFGNMHYHEESAKMLAVYYMCMQGTPFIYQGQEIGMTNAHFTDIRQYNDIETLHMYQTLRRFFTEKKTMKIVNLASRDNARTPMQWNTENAGGFTSGKPWLEVNPNYLSINVSDNEAAADSILHFYRKLIRFRQENPVMIHGNYQEHASHNCRYAMYERNYQNSQVLVLCNFSGKIVKAKIPYDLSDYIAELNNCRVVKDGFLLPYQALVYRRKEHQ